MMALYKSYHGLAFLLVVFLLSACTSHSFVAGVPIHEDSFQQVSLGMGKQEVTNLLGKPYHKYHYETGETWIWTHVFGDYAESLALVFVKDSVTEISLYNETLSVDSAYNAHKKRKPDIKQNTKQDVNIKAFF